MLERVLLELLDVLDTEDDLLLELDLRTVDEERLRLEVFERFTLLEELRFELWLILFPDLDLLRLLESLLDLVRVTLLFEDDPRLLAFLTSVLRTRFLTEGESPEF